LKFDVIFVLRDTRMIMF